MEKKVLSQEEINSLKDLQTKQNELIFSLGQIEYQIILLEDTKQNLKEQVKNLEKESQTLGQKLTEKYGSGKIDLEAGEIIL